MDDAFQRESDGFEWLVTVVSIANDDLRIDNARVCGRCNSLYSLRQIWLFLLMLFSAGNQRNHDHTDINFSISLS